MPTTENNHAKHSSHFLSGLAIDTIAAATAGAITIPCETAKKRYQSGQQVWFGWNTEMLKQTYRGGPAFMTSVGLTTVAQGFAARGFQHYNNCDTLTFNQQLASAGIGGFFSSFSENVILRQQKTGLGPRSAIQSLFQQGMFRPWLGLVSLIGRESIFGLSYMNAESVQNNYGFGAVLLLGAAGSLASHPFDRTATEQQHNEMRSAREAARKIVMEGGISNLYKGGACRIGLFTGCMVSIAAVKSILENATTRTENMPRS